MHISTPSPCATKKNALARHPIIMHSIFIHPDFGPFIHAQLEHSFSYHHESKKRKDSKFVASLQENVPFLLLLHIAHVDIIISLHTRMHCGVQCTRVWHTSMCGVRGLLHWIGHDSFFVKKMRKIHAFETTTKKKIACMCLRGCFLIAISANNPRWPNN